MNDVCHRGGDCLFLSVITVVYNGVNFLENTISSVISQTYTNFEYIVIDGGSRDGTLEIVRKYEKRIKYWMSEPDNGIYDAMNKGIHASSGDYVVFLNAGDRFASYDILANFVKAVTPVPRADLIYGDALEEDSAGKLWLKRARRHSHIWYGMFAHHQAMFFRRAAICKGYDSRYRIGGDYALVAKLCSDPTRHAMRIPFPICIFLQGGVSQRAVALGRSDVWKVQRDILRLNIAARCFIRGMHLVTATVRHFTPTLYNRVSFLRIKNLP